MTEEEKELMKRFGIALEQKSVYIYKDYRYAHLKDAVNYAKIDLERRDAERVAPETNKQTGLFKRLGL
jgi:hypothetical protein